MIGQVLHNRYEILEKTGEGGMAIVYRARDTLLNRQVAVKVLRSQFASDGEFRQRFRREAQAAASLSHPNIVNIYDVGDTGNLHFIVMEYVVGETLNQVVKREGPLSSDYCIRIGSQIAQALAHAHQHGIVHRDIKPHNILISKDDRVKVTDFGIAQALSSANLTQTGMVLGSVHYFSPEQAKGIHVEHYSDLYSLGVVLYEMLTGSVPFKGESPIATALKQIQDQPPSIEDVRSDVPPAMVSLVMKLLEKKPAQRIESAEKTASLLLQLQNDWASVATTAYEPQYPNTQSQPDDENGEWAEEEDMAAGKRTSNSKQAQRKRRRLLPALLVVLLLGTMIWGAQIIVPRILFPAEVQVPPVTELTETEARELLEQYGLQMGIAQEVYDSDIPAGSVVNQEPSAGRTVREGREVAVQVSRGPEYVEVPDVIGLSFREARLQLTQAGFTLGSEEGVMDTDAPLNSVVDQAPESGQEVTRGIAVDLKINRGREALESVEVPDLRGIALDKAEEELKEIGLDIGSTWPEYSMSVSTGDIIEQNPTPGSEVEAGWPVDFVYSQGSPDEGPPAIAGRPDDETDVPGPIGIDDVDRFDDLDISDPEDETEQWEQDTAWKSAEVTIEVPDGRSQEVVILVIDDFGAREVFRETEPGGSRFSKSIQGRGGGAQVQVYIGGRMFLDAPFEDLNES